MEDGKSVILWITKAETYIGGMEMNLEEIKKYDDYFWLRYLKENTVFDTDNIKAQKDWLMQRLERYEEELEEVKQKNKQLQEGFNDQKEIANHFHMMSNKYLSKKEEFKAKNEQLTQENEHLRNALEDIAFGRVEGDYSDARHYANEALDKDERNN
jgi:hypothetical protein